MAVLRVLRISALALLITGLMWLSQQVGRAQGNEPVPGTSWALGVLSLLFFVGAVVTEGTRGREATVQKDLLWGAAAGGVLSILSRL
jgi:hypothetical protein